MAAKTFPQFDGESMLVQNPGITPNAAALGSVPNMLNAPKQPYAMIADVPSSAAALGSVSNVSPAAFTTTEPIAQPTAMEKAGDWLGQNKGAFVSAMGMLSTHFAQTPGQREAGQMIARQGAQEMEQQRKDAAAKEQGFSSSEALEAASKMTEIDYKKAQIASEQMRPAEIKARTDSTIKEMELIDPKIKEMKANIDLTKAKSDIEAQRLEYLKPTPITFEMDGVTRTANVPQGELVQTFEALTKTAKYRQEMELMGKKIKAIEGMAGETIMIGKTKVPIELIQDFMPAFAQQIHGEWALKAAEASGRELGKRLELENTRALNKEQAEAKSKAVENGIKLMEDINKSTQVTSVNGKELSRTESADAPVLRRAFAANAGQMIANGSTWQDARIANQGDQWLTMAVQNKWVTEIDATAMSQGLWRPHGYKDQKPAGAAPGPAAPPEAAPRSTAAPSLSLYGLGPASTGYPKGATEQAIESTIKFPATAASRVLKDYRDIKNLPQ